MSRPGLQQRAYAAVSGDAPRSVTVPIDLFLTLFAVLALVDVQRVLTFHMVFAMLTLTTIVRSGRALVFRAVIGVGLAITAVGIGVAGGDTAVDELYEIPILILMLASVAQALTMWRDAVDRVEGQQERLRSVYNASQIELSDQLLLAQRLDTMGRLSAGVVHNLNNVMTGIVSLAERIEYTATDEDTGDLARRIGRQSMAGGGILEDLLRFARPRGGPGFGDVAEVLSREASMLAMLAGPRVELSIEPSSQPLLAATSPGRIAQMLVNLVLNARDAMPEGGSIRIEARSEGDHAVLSVADTGNGMDEETRARAFDPFFTTKAEGSGSGLGLYTLMQIAEEAGGSVALRSSPMKGTTVEVRLAIQNDESDQHHTPFVETAPERFFGTESVLLVEDDDLIREQLAWSLHLYGYTVHCADDGATALDMVRDGVVQDSGETIPIEFDAIVSDVVMPKIGGVEMLEELRSAGVEVGVVFMSAFDRDNLPEAMNDAPLLHKPFGRNQLLAELRSLLDREGT